MIGSSRKAPGSASRACTVTGWAERQRGAQPGSRDVGVRVSQAQEQSRAGCPGRCAGGFPSLLGGAGHQEVAWRPSGLSRGSRRPGPPHLGYCVTQSPAGHPTNQGPAVKPVGQHPVFRALAVWPCRSHFPFSEPVTQGWQELLCRDPVRGKPGRGAWWGRARMWTVEGAGAWAAPGPHLAA